VSAEVTTTLTTTVEISAGAATWYAIGAALTILGGLVVVIVQNWFRTRRSRRSELLRKYIDGGIDLTINDLSYYGNICILTMLYIANELPHVDRGSLDSFLSAVRRRESVDKAATFDFKSANLGLPRLQLFGMEFFNAVIAAFQTLGFFMENVTDVRKVGQRSTSESSVDIRNSAGLANQMSLFFQQRLLTLSTSMKEARFSTEKELSEAIAKSQSVKALRSEMKCFRDTWNKWWSSSGEERKKTSFELSKWLNDRIEEYHRA